MLLTIVFSCATSTYAKTNLLKKAQSKILTGKALLPLLEGTCRARLLKEKFIVQKDITVEELMNSSKIALMNAMIDFKVINNHKILI